MLRRFPFVLLLAGGSLSCASAGGAAGGAHSHPVRAADSMNAEHDDGTPSAGHSHDGTPPARDSFLPDAYPSPFGADLTTGWLEPWPHSHFSRRGTPYVHLFNLEPAFLDRDLFFDYRRVDGVGEDEVELEVELEWALTRRIGIVLAVGVKIVAASR